MRTAAWTDSVSVLDRVTAVFDAFAEHDEGLGVSELARRANIPKSTVSRIAAELVDQRLLDREGDKFFLGVRLFELGQTVEQPRRLRHIAHPVMAELRDVTGRSVQLGILDAADVVLVAIVRSEPVVRPPARIGGRLPAHATALGKAMLAFSPPEVAAAVVRGGLSSRTPHTISDPLAFVDELRRVRSLGIATETEECVVGRWCAASPVFGSGGAPVAARKTCDECAGFAVTCSCHPVVPRRAMTAVFGSPGPSSNPMAMSAPRAASTSAARASASGSPVSSSSPVMTTRTRRRSSAFTSRSAFKAWIRTTSPPFMSMIPGPRAVRSSMRSKR